MNARTPENEARYNTNPELTKMKEDIADRGYNLKIKSWIITGLTAVAGAAIAGAIGGFALPALVIGGGLGLMAGGTIGEVLTMKERKKLAIDEDMVNSYNTGKNYWGAGYREEVAEYGYGGPQMPAPRNNLAERGTGQRNPQGRS